MYSSTKYNTICQINRNWKLTCCFRSWLVRRVLKCFPTKSVVFRCVSLGLPMWVGGCVSFHWHHYIDVGGRRGAVTLGHVLQFSTGTDGEPILGFELHPSLIFAEVSNSFIPTANTCSNTLYLPHANVTTPVPECKLLFGLYDYAFNFAFFGRV